MLLINSYSNKPNSRSFDSAPKKVAGSNVTWKKILAKLSHSSRANWCFALASVLGAIGFFASGSVIFTILFSVAAAGFSTLALKNLFATNKVKTASAADSSPVVSQKTSDVNRHTEGIGKDSSKEITKLDMQKDDLFNSFRPVSKEIDNTQDSWIEANDSLSNDSQDWDNVLPTQKFPQGKPEVGQEKDVLEPEVSYHFIPKPQKPINGIHYFDQHELQKKSQIGSSSAQEKVSDQEEVKIGNGFLEENGSDVAAVCSLLEEIQKLPPATDKRISLLIEIAKDTDISNRDTILENLFRGLVKNLVGGHTQMLAPFIDMISKFLGIDKHLKTTNLAHSDCFSTEVMDLADGERNIYLTSDFKVFMNKLLNFFPESNHPIPSSANLVIRIPVSKKIKSNDPRWNTFDWKFFADELIFDFLNNKIGIPSMLAKIIKNKIINSFREKNFDEPGVMRYEKIDGGFFLHFDMPKYHSINFGRLSSEKQHDILTRFYSNPNFHNLWLASRGESKTFFYNLIDRLSDGPQKAENSDLLMLEELEYHLQREEVNPVKALKIYSRKWTNPKHKTRARKIIEEARLMRMKAEQNSH